MSRAFFNEFLTSNDTLRVYRDGELVFASRKGGLRSLLEYASLCIPEEPAATVFDRVVGNAAALLIIKVACREVYSPLGSELAAATLRDAGIGHHFTRTVPYIKNRSRDRICPMEELSRGKNPDEFLRTCQTNLSGQGI